MPKWVNLPILEAFGRQLAAARARNAFSQRRLAQNVGMTQAHISKIEQGQVDLRLSSLVELARALDLDVQLVPRQAVLAVEGVRRAVEAQPPSAGESRALAILSRQSDVLDRLDERYPGLRAVQRLRDRLYALGMRALGPAAVKRLQHAVAPVERAASEDLDLDALTRVLERADRHLSRLDADQPSSAEPEAAQPAFRLDEDDDD